MQVGFGGQLSLMGGSWIANLGRPTITGGGISGGVSVLNAYYEVVRWKGCGEVCVEVKREEKGGRGGGKVEGGVEGV